MIKIRKIPTIFIILVILSASIILVVSYNYHQQEITKLNNEINDLEQEIEKIKQEAEELKEKLNSKSYHDNFNFIYGHGVRSANFTNELNTFNGTYRRDMVIGPPETIRLILKLNSIQQFT